MCKERDSIGKRRSAAEALRKTCLECADGITAALHKVYDDTLAEGTPDDLRQLVGKLQ